MKGIEQVREAKKVYSPLIPAYWIRVYRLTFLAVVILLLMVSLVIELSNLPFTLQLEVPVIIKQYSDRALLYIIAFWCLPGLMYTFDKNRTGLVRNK